MPAVLEGRLADLSSWKPTECSLVKALDVVGTRSALCILREAFYGTTRFDGFADRIGITEAVAAKQLRKLTEEGLLTKQPYQEPGQRTRYEYVLTPKGRALLPVVLALMEWGNTYLQEFGPPLLMVEDGTDSPLHVEVRSELGNDVPLEKVRIRLNGDIYTKYRAKNRAKSGSKG